MKQPVAQCASLRGLSPHRCSQRQSRPVLRRLAGDSRRDAGAQLRRRRRGVRSRLPERIGVGRRLADHPSRVRDPHADPPHHRRTPQHVCRVVSHPDLVLRRRAVRGVSRCGQGRGSGDAGLRDDHRRAVPARRELHLVHPRRRLLRRDLAGHRPEREVDLRRRTGIHRRVDRDRSRELRVEPEVGQPRHPLARAPRPALARPPRAGGGQGLRDRGRGELCVHAPPKGDAVRVPDPDRQRPS